jgi:hypothetical protein
MKNFYLLLIVTFVLFINVSHVHSTLVWDWWFENPIQTVAPTDIVPFRATIFNNPSSNENLIYLIDDPSHQGFNILGGYGYALGVYGSAQGNYPHPFWEQFIGLNLAPGETFTLNFFTFYPLNGAGPDGYELWNNAGLQVIPNDQSRGRVIPSSTNGMVSGDFILQTWHFYVDASVPPTPHPPFPPSTPVPEPCTLFLFATGLIGLLKIRKKLNE